MPKNSDQLSMLTQANYQKSTSSLSDSLAKTLALLENEETKLFVYDEPILRYEIKRRGLEDEIEVLPKTLKKDYYGYSFPKNSVLVDEINPVLIGVLKTMEWNSIMSKYE